MGLGIIKVRHVDVPGTTRFFGDAASTDTGCESLKRDGDMVLIPQPSDDPRDPLNWPLWKRDLMFGLLCGGCIMAATLGPILATNTFVLLIQFHTTFADIASLTGFQLVGVATAAPFLLATSRVYGKRHAYLLGCLFLFTSAIWAAEAATYKSLLAARIVQGIGILPFEALLVASVGDMYFVHQRGLRIAVASLALIGTTFLTPIVVGRMTHSIGWRWSFRLVALFSGLFGIGVFLYGPEHVYPRSNLVPGIKEIQEKEGTIIVYPYKEQTFVQSLVIFSGRKSADKLWKLILRPFPLFFTHPAIIWGCLIQGTFVGWITMVGAVIAALYSGPPHWLNETHIGYLYTSPFVGSIIAFVYLGWTADWSVKYLTRRNNNIYEPEFRIVQILPGLIIGSIGIFGFGISCAKGYSTTVGGIFFGCIAFGLIVAATASSAYIVDGYRSLNVEGFICLLMFKNFFGFALTQKVADWIMQTPVDQLDTKMFNIIGIVQVVVCLTCIPMYVYGKKCRDFTHRYDVLKYLGLD